MKSPASIEPPSERFAKPKQKKPDQGRVEVMQWNSLVINYQR
jgi:hypothetical protein